MDVTKWQGERQQNRADFDSIFERSQNHNLELIQTKLWSCTENCRAWTRGSQRDLFTSPRRTRKNKGLSKHSAARLQYHWNYQIIKKYFSSSLEVVFILWEVSKIDVNWRSHIGRWKDNWLEHSRGGLQFPRVFWASVQSSLFWS